MAARPRHPRTHPLLQPAGECGNWTAIKKKELEIISQEIKRCQEDFVYFAKNYVWITDKSNRDILFSLWEGQELILEKILWMKSRGMAQKLILIKARQLGASTCSGSTYRLARNVLPKPQCAGGCGRSEAQSRVSVWYHAAHLRHDAVVDAADVLL